MGGRGCGRGSSSMSFTMEQLGVGRGDSIPSMAAPMPDYPLLEYYPAPIEPTAHDRSMLHYKESLNAALARIREALADPTPSSSRPATDLGIDWSRLPADLRPVSGKRKAKSGSSAAQQTPAKLAKIKNVNALLDELEKKESNLDVVKKEADEEEEFEDAENENNEAAVDEEDEMDLDEEMDEGTDYNQNYFDNGENYLDEDDDGDDGPIY